MVAFSTLAGLGQHDPALRGQRVLVLKALGSDERMPYFAMLTQGFPRLVTVSADRVVEQGSVDLGEAVASFVLYQDEPALVPDMDGIEERLHAALAA